MMKMKLKGLHFADVAEIQEAAQEVQKEEFSAFFFSETVRPCNSLSICQWSLFCMKKGMCLRLLKIQS